MWDPACELNTLPYPEIVGQVLEEYSLFAITNKDQLALGIS
jgi:hypothetical protein